MSLSWGVLLGVAQVVWVVFIASFILLERRSPTATLAWITMVAALPLVGVAIYLVVGPRRLQRKRLRLALARDRIGALLSEWKGSRARLLSLQGQLMRAGAQVGEDVVVRTDEPFDGRLTRAEQLRAVRERARQRELRSDDEASVARAHTGADRREELAAQRPSCVGVVA